MSEVVRPMWPDEEPEVRDIYRQAHPTWPPLPRLWFFAYPTLVLESDGVLIGYTSFTVVPDSPGLALLGQDTAVLPMYRGMGFGRLLYDERLRYGRDVGCHRFIGATQPDNVVVQHILTAQGFAETQRVPGAFPNDTEAVLFVGPIPDGRTCAPPGLVWTGTGYLTTSACDSEEA